MSDRHSLYDLMYVQPTDEASPIAFGSGTKEGHSEMWRKVREMSDQQLVAVWNSLSDYNPCNYYNAYHGIGMDDWAYCISAVMDERNIPHFA